MNVKTTTIIPYLVIEEAYTMFPARGQILLAHPLHDLGGDPRVRVALQHGQRGHTPKVGDV